jgi:cold-inducible RNA-binding protein
MYVPGQTRRNQLTKQIFVGNLPYSYGDGELEALFQPHGTIKSAKVIVDRETGRSKGFGFVEMSSDDEAAAAISALSGADADGKSLTVNEARPREPRAPRKW